MKRSPSTAGEHAYTRGFVSPASLRMTLVAVILMLLSTLLITRYEVYHSEVVSPD